MNRTVIDSAKEALSIPTLWRLLNLPGEPKASCHSPFRDDKKASFSIFDKGRQAKDHATGETFDGPAFLGKALGISGGQALQRFVAMANSDGGNPTANFNAASTNGSGNVHSECFSPDSPKPDLSHFRPCQSGELCAIARDRNLDQAAIDTAHQLGCLKCGRVCSFSSWLLTDLAGWNAEARRFGRLVYPAYGDLSERKAHTLRGSIKRWPVGLGVDRALVEKASLIAVLEGGPDYLAAWHFILRSKRQDILPITVLGRTVHGLHPDALSLLAKKRVKFFPHIDPDKGGLKQIRFIADQLRTVGCRPTYFDLTALSTVAGQWVKDLNDVVMLDKRQLAELRGLFL